MLSICTEDARACRRYHVLCAIPVYIADPFLQQFVVKLRRLSLYLSGQLNTGVDGSFTTSKIDQFKQSEASKMHPHPLTCLRWDKGREGQPSWIDC